VVFQQCAVFSGKILVADLITLVILTSIAGVKDDIAIVFVVLIPP
jgi:hypothetical protein